MSRHQKLVYFAAYVMAATVAVATVSAAERDRNQSESSKNRAPQGQSEQVSDWALAGIVWSDASLARKVAIEALRQNPSSDQQQRLEDIVTETQKVIDELEQFGWKQTRASSDSAVSRSSIKVLDTETPIGADDPGLDDEKIPPKSTIDIEQYRVDDYVDETPAEAANLADALEDGTEAAIAAASGRRTISGRVAGRISEREVMTRSSTMAYSEDSIYDRDDYDPDIDYQIDNPAGVRFDNVESIDRGDGDDDISPGFARVVDGEDELLANQIRKSRANRSSSIERYTSSSTRHQHDADWVQFHLDTNQLLWQHLSSRDNLTESAIDALRRLKASSMTAARATSSDKLQSILQPIESLSL